ncbi:MAG TPA: uracil-DNA glycosylase [Longimicrobiales bacterium]|nr:uracil-DNA glycosylase [Longimicrobiales bacterium]
MNGPDLREVARFLRQRREMGLPPLVLGETPREALLAFARELARRLPEEEAGAAVQPPPSASRRPPARPAPTPEPAPATSGSGAAAPASDTPAPSLPDLSTLDYDGLRELALGCTRCGLAETRTQVVFSDGNPDARLVVVGEAPGANEDRTGLPFVGQAGQLLDLMLASVDLSREQSVYICNVLKCRPPGNRNPQPDEIRACSPFLKRQLALVQPEALLAVGTFAAQLLTSRDAPLGKLRGEVHSYEGIPLVVTYHPAALLRNSGWVQAAWDDLQLLRQVMD